jgi:hypothetical protein
MLSQDSARAVNDDELIELMTVPGFEGPMMVANLRDHGIEATAVDSYNVVTGIASNARVFVRRRDLASAQAVVAPRSLDEIE